MPNDSSRISAEEAARRLGITADEVIDLRRRGKLRGYPDYGDWVFEEADVAQLAEEMQAVAPDTPESTTSPPEPSASTSTESEQPPAVPVSATEPDEELDDTSSPYQPATLASQTNDDPGSDPTSPRHPAVPTCQHRRRQVPRHLQPPSPRQPRNRPPPHLPLLPPPQHSRSMKLSSRTSRSKVPESSNRSRPGTRSGLQRPPEWWMVSGITC